MERMALAFISVLFSIAAVAAQPSPTTRVDISSQPEHAVVVIDGADRGFTPMTLFDLAPGRHHVKFRMPGYVELDRYITVEEGRPSQHNNVLEPEKGLLLVKSDPEGCEITVDGVAMGLTPRLITTLNTMDSHLMTLRKTGYREADFEIKFSGRKPLVREETLILDSGVLKIETEPAGAHVMVNGVDRGTTPQIVTDVPKGRATVKLTLPGFKDEIISDIMIGAGDRQTISRILEGLPGTLSISTVPEDVRLYVNGEYSGKSPLVLSGMQPGSYEVRAEREGFAVETRTIEVMNGATPHVEFRMVNIKGRLEVTSSPPGAQVYFDGRLVGTTASEDADAETSDKLMIEDVIEGEHLLVLRKYGYAEATRHPKIQRSKTSRANVRMKRVFKPDIEIETYTGTYQGILVSNTPDYIIIEVTLGVQRSFPRADIKKVRFLDGEGE